MMHGASTESTDNSFIRIVRSPLRDSDITPNTDHVGKTSSRAGGKPRPSSPQLHRVYSGDASIYASTISSIQMRHDGSNSVASTSTSTSRSTLTPTVSLASTSVTSPADSLPSRPHVFIPVAKNLSMDSPPASTSSRAGSAVRRINDALTVKHISTWSTTAFFPSPPKSPRIISPLPSPSISIISTLTPGFSSPSPISQTCSISSNSSQTSPSTQASPPTVESSVEQIRLGTCPVTEDEMDELIMRMQDRRVGTRARKLSERNHFNSGLGIVEATEELNINKSPPNDRSLLPIIPALSRLPLLSTSVSDISLATTSSSSASFFSSPSLPSISSSTLDLPDCPARADTDAEDILASLIKKYKTEIEESATSQPSSSAPVLPLIIRKSLLPYSFSPAASTLSVAPSSIDKALPRSKIKTIDEIIEEGGGVKLGANALKRSKALTPAQLVILATRNKDLAESIVNKPSLDSPPPTSSFAGNSSNPASLISNSSQVTATTTNSAAALTKYLNSSRLTRIISLTRSVGSVSIADVGDGRGKAVVCFLGLGAVRYLIGLYDELAKVLGIRLICIDRWGIGRTPVATYERSYSLWAGVVEEVLDQLEVTEFNIIGHSAGSPYALATALRCTTRVKGVHLLAPWLSKSHESLAGAYKLLAYMPSSVLRTAQSAEWKLENWRLGKQPKVIHAPIGFNHRAVVDPRFEVEALAEPGLVRDYNSNSSMNSYLSSTIDSTAHGSTSSSLSFSNNNIGRTKKSTLSAATSSILNRFTQSSNSIRTARSDSVYSTDATDVLYSRTSGPRASFSASMRSPTIASEDSTRSSYSLTSHDIVTGLLRASHAESKGATSDLLLILGRTGNEEGVEFGHVEQQVTIYYGTKDDRISLSSIEIVQKQMKNCQIKLIEGGDHNLMTNSQVMIGVLESIVAHVS